MDIQLKIALIAASAALSGVILSQIISLLLSFIEKKHKKEILMRQKYEEMMFYFQDSLTYYSDVANCITLEELFSQTHSVPAQKAMGLARLYFPKFAPQFEIYFKNLVEYYSVVVSSFNPNIKSNAGGQARVHNKKQIDTVEQNLFLVKNTIIEKFEKNAIKYTKA